MLGFLVSSARPVTRPQPGCRQLLIIKSLGQWTARAVTPRTARRSIIPANVRPAIRTPPGCRLASTTNWPGRRSARAVTPRIARRSITPASARLATPPRAGCRPVSITKSQGQWTARAVTPRIAQRSIMPASARLAMRPRAGCRPASITKSPGPPTARAVTPKTARRSIMPVNALSAIPPRAGCQPVLITPGKPTARAATALRPGIGPGSAVNATAPVAGRRSAWAGIRFPSITRAPVAFARNATMAIHPPIPAINATTRARHKRNTTKRASSTLPAGAPIAIVMARMMIDRRGLAQQGGVVDGGDDVDEGCRK